MSSKQSPVVFVAGIFRDLVAVSPRFPAPGETIIGTDFQMGFGGKGANQCVMASRLGAHTAIVGKVGEDDHGKAYRNSLEEDGVDLSHMGVEKETNTGIAVIFVESNSGENEIIIVPGANAKATPEFVMNAEELIARSKAVICQLEMNMEGSLAALKLARKHGILTILNAAPGRADLNQEFLLNTDILCVNETEAELLCGLPANNEQEWRACVEALHNKGCGTVVLTLGASGAMVGVSGQKVDLVPAPKVSSVVDTTGAGDAFVGSLAFYLTERPELGMLETVRRSCHVASMSVQRPGTQASYPKHEDVPKELLQ